MNVLIYVEPHPIRGSLTQFNAVAQRFLPLLTQAGGAEIRLFANRATLDAVVQRDSLWETVESKLMRSLPEEDAIFQAFSGDWHDQGVAQWQNLMNGGTVATAYLPLLQRLHQVFPFQVMVYWGENGAVRRFAATHGITAIAMELGCTRPPFFDALAMDAYGTNGNTLISKLTIDDLSEIVEGATLSAAAAQWRYSTDTMAYDGQFAPLPPALRRALRGQTRVALLPLQLYDDANLLHFSPYKTVRDVVLAVVPPLAAAGYFTVIKPHPVTRQRANAHVENEFARASLEPWKGQFFWCDGEGAAYSNPSLLRLADLVVTVNSSVGFEALYYDKPVVVLGDAVYKPQKLFPSLEAVVTGEFAGELPRYRAQLGVLREFLLNGYLLPATLTDDALGFVQELRLWDAAWQSHATQPRHLARAVYCHRHRVQAHRYRYPLATTSASESQAIATARAIFLKTLLPKVQALQAESGTATEKEFIDWVAQQWSMASGRRQVLTALAWVDEAFYLATYSDVAAQTQLSPLDHFLLHGLGEGRRANEAAPRLKENDLLIWLQTALQESLASIASAPMATLLPWYPRWEMLIAASGHQDAAAFAAWLSAQWQQSNGRRQVLETLAWVDDAFYLRTHPDVAAQNKLLPLAHYLLHGLAERRPANDFAGRLDGEGLLARFQTMAQAHFAARRSAFLREYPLAITAQTRLDAQQNTLRQALAASTHRFAVIVHGYFVTGLSELFDALTRLPEPFDLFVTLPEWGTEAMEAVIQTRAPTAYCCHFPSRGDGLGRFVALLPLLLERDYDAVLVIHNRADGQRDGRWQPLLSAQLQQLLLDHILPDTATLGRWLAQFREQPQVNLLAPHAAYQPVKPQLAKATQALWQSLLPTSPVAVAPSAAFTGGMYWLRPQCVAPLVTAPWPLTWESFDDDFALNPMTVSRADQVAVLLSWLAQQHGGIVAGIQDQSPPLLRWSPPPAPQPLVDYLATQRHQASGHPSGLMWVERR